MGDRDKYSRIINGFWDGIRRSRKYSITPKNRKIRRIPVEFSNGASQRGVYGRFNLPPGMDGKEGMRMLDADFC